MASRPEPFRPVDAHGSLRINTPSGRPLNLAAHGEMLRVELPGWGDARGILPRSLRGRIRAIRTVADMLAAHGLLLSLELAGEPVVRLGHGTASSWLSWLLGLGSTDLSIKALRALARI